MKNYLLVFSILLLTLSVSLTAQESVSKIHPLSGKVGWSVEGGGTYTLADFQTDEFNFFGRTMLEYYFPSTQPGIWGLRAMVTGGFLSGSGASSSERTDLSSFKTTFIQAGAGGEYLFMASSSVHPYIFAGASYMYFDPKDNDGNRLLRNSAKDYSRNTWNIIGELGIKFLASENIGLNVGANVNYFPNDNLDDVKAGSDRDIFFTGFGGLTVYFGGTSDKDRDGIRDEDDQCPGTPAGVMVDQFGCPVDSDGDRVPDYLDKCPNTTHGMPVDKDGCPLDTDEDGVPDYLDLCKDTPEGVAVDKRGCPFDEDGDGVPDYKDKCPGTPIGVEVNSFGCAPEVNKKELPEKVTMTITGNVLFEVGKSQILPDAKAQLMEMVSVIKKQPASRWLIAGHTDNTGSYQNNKRLSLARANSVADFLIQNGVNRSQLEVTGNGPDNPVADNSTESGRAMNRRVTIDYIDGDFNQMNIQQPKPVTGIMHYDSANERHVGNMIFTDGNTYVFQVASFRTRSQAERIVQSLNNAGEKAFIIEANVPELDGTWYRVRVGFYQTLYEAKTNQARVMAIVK